MKRKATHKKLLSTIYRALYLARRADEEIAKVYPSGKIHGPIHLSIGQEAVSVGVCQALKPKDVVFGTYRSHALYLAKGGDPKKMIAELYGKATGSSKGKGGSMHLGDVRMGMLATSAIVGTGIANAVGYAYGLKVQQKPNVVANFFGDGAVDEGVFNESLNFAALKKLPIIFICENNFYALRSHQKKRQPVSNIVERSAVYGIPAKRIEGNDVLKIYAEVKRAREKILRNGSGPQFFECMTYRWKEHLGPGDDFHLGYRSRREAEPWMKNDQLKRIGAMLSPKLREKIETGVETEIHNAFIFAEKSQFPHPKELYTDVFK